MLRAFKVSRWGFRMFRVYLDPKEPTFSGFPNMISLYYKSLER